MPLTAQLFVGLKCRFDDAPAVGLISFRCCIFVRAWAVSTSAMESSHHRLLREGLFEGLSSWLFDFFAWKSTAKYWTLFLKSESLYTDSNFSSWVLYGAPVQSSYSLSVYTTARTRIISSLLCCLIALCNTCFHFPVTFIWHLASINPPLHHNFIHYAINDKFFSSEHILECVMTMDESPVSRVKWDMRIPAVTYNSLGVMKILSHWWMNR